MGELADPCELLYRETTRRRVRQRPVEVRGRTHTPPLTGAHHRGDARRSGPRLTRVGFAGPPDHLRTESLEIGSTLQGRDAR